MSRKSLAKVTLVVIMGNILEYYDFLLFAHLGFMITPLFFPFASSTQTHMLSLLLFGLSFMTRPIGGYIFGRLSDKEGRKIALMKSVRWAVLPAIGFALLPNYETIGITSSCLFVLLRLIQGIALGGEYPIAGTYLMELRKSNQGLFSSLLVAAGSVGSIIGLGFAIICMQPEAPAWLWRVAFLLGGVGVVVSYYMRKYLGDFYIPPAKLATQENADTKNNRLLIFIVSLIAGSIMWIPMTYSNFYITKILHLPTQNGLYASLIALVSYILVLPFFGVLYDKIETKKYMLASIAAICPLSIFAIYMLSHGYIAIAQISLIFAAAGVGAPIHKLFNSLFPKELRGRNIGFIYMLGLSFGGLLPSISSYIVDKTRFDLAPAILISIVAFVTYFSFKKLYTSHGLSMNNKNV